AARTVVPGCACLTARIGVTARRRGAVTRSGVPVLGCVLTGPPSDGGGVGARSGAEPHRGADLVELGAAFGVPLELRGVERGGGLGGSGRLRELLLSERRRVTGLDLLADLVHRRRRTLGRRRELVGRLRGLLL